MENYNPNAIESLKTDLTKQIPQKFRNSGITSFSYLEEALNSLDPIKQIIIERKYGLFGNAQNLKEISKILKLFEERVRQLEENILEQLITYSIRKEWEVNYGNNNPELPIEISELNYRIKKVCRWEKIETIEELSLLGKSDILKIKNIGLESVKEIENYLLNQFGIKLS